MHVDMLMIPESGETLDRLIAANASPSSSCRETASGSSQTLPLFPSPSTTHRCAQNTPMSLKAVQTSRLMQAYLYQLKNNELRTKAITAGPFAQRRKPTQGTR